MDCPFNTHFQMFFSNIFRTFFTKENRDNSLCTKLANCVFKKQNMSLVLKNNTSDIYGKQNYVKPNMYIANHDKIRKIQKTKFGSFGSSHAVQKQDLAKMF